MKVIFNLNSISSNFTYGHSFDKECEIFVNNALETPVVIGNDPNKPVGKAIIVAVGKNKVEAELSVTEDLIRFSDCVDYSMFGKILKNVDGNIKAFRLDGISVEFKQEL
jgi:hypothetical protein